jgi:hypothetical protein
MTMVDVICECIVSGWGGYSVERLLCDCEKMRVEGRIIYHEDKSESLKLRREQAIVKVTIH